MNYTAPLLRCRSSLPVAVLALLALPLLTACTVAHDEDPESVTSTVDAPPDAAFADAAEQAGALIREAMVEENLPGVSVAVGVDGEIVWAEGFGWADIAKQTPVTPETRFRIGSVAMPMTATAVGLLYERGMVDLDAPVRTYVPAYPEKRWTVTPRQLMGHVAGIRTFTDDEEPMYQYSACNTPMDALPLYADDELGFEPGTQFRFSPYGWTLVGAVVEATTDQPFLDFMQEEVFDPLDMEDTVLDDREMRMAQDASFYFPATARDPSRGVHYVNDGDQTCFQGAEALLSTPADIVRFGFAILEGRLLADETQTMLQTPLELPSGESTGHALGWFIGEADLGGGSGISEVYGYEGSASGSTTSFVTLPEHGIVVAISTNVAFAKNIATEREFGAGVSPFFRDGALPHELAEIFAAATGR